MKRNKNLRLLKGVILHPFKSFIFHLSGGANKYDILAKKADYRQQEKAFERKIYLSSLTGTNINL